MQRNDSRTLPSHTKRFRIQCSPDGGFVDPEEVFGAKFGGEGLVPIIRAHQSPERYEDSIAGGG